MLVCLAARQIHHGRGVIISFISSMVGGLIVPGCDPWRSARAGEERVAPCCTISFNRAKDVRKTRRETGAAGMDFMEREVQSTRISLGKVPKTCAMCADENG